MDQEYQEGTQAQSENVNGMPEQGDTMHMDTPQTGDSKNLIISIVIAVVVVVLVLMYLWGAGITGQPAEDVSQVFPVEDEQVTALEQVGTSDEVSAIEQDILTTNLDALDADLDAMEAEMDALLTE